MPDIKEQEEKLTFEEALSRLEEAVAKIDGGALSLDECLREYEKGIRLASFCAGELASAREKVEKLQKRENGSLEAVEAAITSDRSGNCE